MRILDVEGNELECFDAAAGYLTEESIFKAHHKAEDSVKEEWHYEVVAEYPNGGKDVKRVIDKPGIEEKEAFDEYETILRFTPYTEKELAEIRIEELKKMLFETDYNILKVVEGAQNLSDCAEIVKKRAEWRKEINTLERVLQ